MVGRGIAFAYHDGGWHQALGYLAQTLNEADIALANLESPISPYPPILSGQEHPECSDPSKPQLYNLCSGPLGLQALKFASIDLLSLANNHALDCAPDGLSLTRQALSDAGLQAITPGPVPILKEVNGLKLAFFALDDVASLVDVDSVTRAIATASDSGHIVVVSFHWGSEYQGGPSPRQQLLAQTLIDAGASLIWGHHPHVLQRLEWVRGKCLGSSLNSPGLNVSSPGAAKIQGICTPPTRSPALVAYSLGNALFDQVTPPDATRSALLVVELDSNGVQSVQAVPFIIDGMKGLITRPDIESAAAVLRRLGSIVNPTQTP